MYLKIVCLNELNRNHFYPLPLRLRLLPLNKNCFTNIVGFCVYIINTINTRLLGDMEFLFSCSIRVEHSKRNSISPRAHVLLSISLVSIQDTIYLFVVVNEAKGQPSCEHYINKFKLTSYIVFK